MYALVMAPGCKLGPKLTLREAEELAHQWLQNLQEGLEREAESSTRRSKPATHHEEDESTDTQRPATLRDCFVDDGWVPEGFRNPTEALAWLNEDRRSVGRVLSIDVAEGGAALRFEMKGKTTERLEATIVASQDWPRCKMLRKAKENEQATNK